MTTPHPKTHMLLGSILRTTVRASRTGSVRRCWLPRSLMPIIARSVTAGVLAWDQAKPGSEMTAAFEVFSVAGGGNHGCSGLGTDTADLRNALTGLIGFEDGINPLVALGDLRNTVRAGETLVRFPMYSGLTADPVDYVIDRTVGGIREMLWR